MIVWTDPRGAELDRLCREESEHKKKLDATREAPVATRSAKPVAPRQLRKCTRCKEEKDSGEFYKQAHSRTGIDWWCKSCRNISNREYQKNHRETCREAVRRWRRRHREKWNTYQREHRKNVSAEESTRSSA